MVLRPELVMCSISFPLQEHCIISNIAGKLHLRKCAEGASVFVNGKPVTSIVKVQLNHNDRIFIGSNHVFRVAMPGEPASESPDKFDWMFEFSEKNQAEIASVKAMEAERRAALEEEVGPSLQMPVLATVAKLLNRKCVFGS